MRERGSQETLPSSSLEQALNPGMHLAQSRVAGSRTSEWTPFLYHGEAPDRAALGALLEVPPESLALRTRDGQPLAALGDAVSTGDALLDQALSRCSTQQMALPLSPEPLAALCPDLWRDAKAVKNWKAGKSASEILKSGPPEGWGAVEYRLRSRRSAEAWVPLGAEPRAAIAKGLGVDPEDIIVLEAARAVESAMEKRAWSKPIIAEEPLAPAEFSEVTELPQSRPKRAWSVPHIVETENSLWPREVHLRLPFSTEPPRVARIPRPLSFAAILREDEGEGVLLTEHVCQSDWSPSDMQPQPAVHQPFRPSDELSHPRWLRRQVQ
jgi:hypothetical protein